MANHRATVGSSRPSVTPQSYVGKRRATGPAHSEPDQGAAAPAAYVGKRRAAPKTESTNSTVSSATPDYSNDPAVRRAFEATRSTHETTADPWIHTGELRAMVDQDLEGTAPNPPVKADRKVAGLSEKVADKLPGKRARRTNNDAAPTLDDLPAISSPLPVVQPFTQPVSEATQTAAAANLAKPLTDSSIELPRISVAATYSDDFTSPTHAVPATAGGSTRRRIARPSRVSMPLAVGAAALAVAAGGAAVTVNASDAPEENVLSTPVNAMTGTSSVSDAGGSLDRDPVTSRSGGNRTASAAENEASAREKALDQLDEKADGQNKILELNRWGLPLDSYRLTAGFGEYGLWSSSHTGLDFAAPAGTAIHAVARGTVTETGYDGSYGNKTVVTLEDGTEMWYCHQTSFGVSVGDTVNQGDTIGTVGSTGNSTGPHLHLEVRPGGGDPVDPYAALTQNGVNP